MITTDTAYPKKRVTVTHYHGIMDSNPPPPLVEHMEHGMSVILFNNGSDTTIIEDGPTRSGPWVLLKSMKGGKVEALKDCMLYVRPRNNAGKELDLWVTQYKG